MNTKQFLSDVMHEINGLRNNATEEEKNNLNLESFDATDPTDCIYGQATGNCCSKRAKELMDVSCIRIMKLGDRTEDIEGLKLKELMNRVNGEYKGQTWGGESEDIDYMYRNYSHLSALEGYIYTKEAKIAEIMEYIKGNTKKLQLN